MGVFVVVHARAVSGPRPERPESLTSPFAKANGEDRARQRPGGGDSVLSRVSSRPHHRQDEAQHTLVFVFHMDRSHADNLHAALPQPHNSKNIEIF
ncbi:MAG: hypothetical protein A2795_11765 [Caulobacterales bacterium RIFCSPHIGHO2_01_FULL_67_30]|nr:MAG: hypothetical protein A2795_11765 [Caulobacterales bacterium RIFCSPHIGHO2_01_FULL_67_30]